MSNAKPTVVLIGAVQSTAIVLDKLAEHQAAVVGVFGYESGNTDHVSGYTNLGSSCRNHGFHYVPFKNINQRAADIRDLKPDYIFVVGLSQLVSEEILEIPTQCCIGFHPTPLPFGRGRAPLAWLIIEQQTEGAATFFKLEDGVDNGAIVAQAQYSISENDDVADLIDKLLQAMGVALDELLPSLESNTLNFAPQDESQATYYEKRTPDDGLIDWHGSADQICRLVRATADPYPGAYFFVDDQKITIHTAEVFTDKQILGVVGRVVYLGEDGAFVVQCGDGLLLVKNYLSNEGWGPRIGVALGYKAELEIYLLKKRMEKLEKLLLPKQ